MMINKFNWNVVNRCQKRFVWRSPIVRLLAFNGDNDQMSGMNLKDTASEIVPKPDGRKINEQIKEKKQR